MAGTQGSWQHCCHVVKWKLHSPSQFLPQWNRLTSNTAVPNGSRLSVSPGMNDYGHCHIHSQDSREFIYWIIEFFEFWSFLCLTMTMLPQNTLPSAMRFDQLTKWVSTKAHLSSKCKVKVQNPNHYNKKFIAEKPTYTMSFHRGASQKTLPVVRIESGSLASRSRRLSDSANPTRLKQFWFGTLTLTQVTLEKVLHFNHVSLEKGALIFTQSIQNFPSLFSQQHPSTRLKGKKKAEMHIYSLQQQKQHLFL